MTLFVSTRGGNHIPLNEALFAGLAPDGGLYVPTNLTPLPSDPPRLTDLAATAHWVSPSLFGGTDADLIGRVATAALTFPSPLVEVEPGIFVLELFHGPTHAFKDIAARFMARLMAELDTQDALRTILVATSGDTGSAVAQAFHQLEGYRVVVMFPKDGISERQRRQMTTLGGNVHALAVRGTFDDCQRMAKEAFTDPNLSKELRLTSANSINVGRLLPQSLYYTFAAASLGWSSTPALFVAPSGNLGNLCGGLLAQMCGMPSLGFISAMNVNRGFADFLELGNFEARPSISTDSNAMDVGDPSNLERIRWLYRNDYERLRRDVTGISVADDETRSCISDLHDRTGYVLDPHTAVAYRALERQDGHRSGPAVVIATAHPAKFPEVVEEAIGQNVPLPEGIASVMGAEEHMDEMPAELDALRAVLEAN
ncbi:MAG: threonine synthase [Gemmatimonadetes bacterium]|nr:threonine synthase [Gemmatimonadota bacterium]